MSTSALNLEGPFSARAEPRSPASRAAAPGRGGAVQRVKLGNLDLPNRYFLAPLAGVSDWPFRLLCRELGASIAHTEMISSHGLVHGGDRTLAYLERPADERPFAIQVFGHDPQILAEGARVAVGLHPRTRSQMYRGKADWELIRKTKQAVRISVWGSGDLFTAEAAMRMLAETGADAARIARGACGHPWIFRELLALERGEEVPEVTLDEWRETVLRHVRLAIEEKQGKHRLQRPAGAPRPRADRPNGGHAQLPFTARDAELAAVRELRKHLLWYTRGRRGGLAFRRVASELHTEDDVRRALDRFFPADGSVPAEVRDEPVGPRELTADD